ncbi:MAG: hypothetical protein JWN04_4886 [Myxococcaceae bacterium]|nr:hypothetical protein [Myxococcaceae bacterium]
MYRATLNLPPYMRSPQQEACVDSEAKADSIANKAHSAFGTCHESAQDECPGWPSKDMQKSLDDCLAAMWKEGPGDDFNTHGHYLNMSNKSYTHVACGVYDIGNGKFWATQDFY